jgi:acyl carrier protein
MGLDVVELVMRCEESFGISLENDRLESMRTVGDLFELICSQLAAPPSSDERQPANKARDLQAIATEEGWTRDAIWSELVRICVDQLQVTPDKITYSASFVDDLGAD